MSALDQRLRAALGTALRERNAVALGALRSTLAALENATAVPSGSPPPVGDEHVAGRWPGSARPRCRAGS